ncbi:MAG: germination protein YpeB [Clostridia bacterium]|nr:germination protein YpeB [Clostridia bacterium]
MRETAIERRERIKTVIAIVVIVLLAGISGVFAALYATARAEESAADERYRALAESTYRKSYYSLLYNMDGLEGATNKLTVASGKALRQEYLSDISSYATAAAENMSDFTPEEAGDSRIMKFINQTGDFAKYLDDKLNKGGSISESDRATL